MASEEEKKLRTIIRNYILFFIIVIVLNGISIFPIEAGLAYVHYHIQFFPTLLRGWLNQVYFGVKATNEQFPFLSYGTDWLAFAHLVIAMIFLGPLKDPVKNVWIIQWAMIACLCVFPLVLIAGPIRGIPLYWQLIDCSLGLMGVILLYLCYKKIVRLKSTIERVADKG